MLDLGTTTIDAKQPEFLWIDTLNKIFNIIIYVIYYNKLILYNE